MLRNIAQIYEKFGFAPRESPALERLETILQVPCESSPERDGASATTAGNSELAAQLYSFTDRGASQVALRPDHTLSLARFVVQHTSEIQFPFRSYTHGRVFRGERAQRGRRREFTQIDADILGVKGALADAEIIAVIIEALRSVGSADFQLRLNHRKIMNGAITHVNASDKATPILRTIDKLDKVGEAEVRRLFAGDEIKLQDDQIAFLMQFIQTRQPDGTGLAQFLAEQGARYSNSNADFAAGFADLREIALYLQALGTDEKHLRVDFAVARGLDYYSGMVFEGSLTQCPGIGSICGGGRYDNLTGVYSVRSLPGVGGSIGLDRLIDGMSELHLINGPATPAQISVVYSDEPVQARKLIELAAKLRQAGIRVDLHPQPTQLGRQLSRAQDLGLKYAIIGVSEDGTQVTIADLTTRERRSIAVNTLGDLLDGH